MENNWKSFHVFVWDYSLFDEIIENTYKYFEEVNIEKAFFIRYWEGGPHLRFRIETPLAYENSKRIFENMLNQISEHNPYLERITLNKKQFYESSFLDGQNINIEKLPWYPNLSVYQIPYNREFDRYGGENLINLSEECFVDSSKVAVQVIRTDKRQSYKVTFFFTFVSFILKNVVCEEDDIRTLLNMAANFWEKAEIKRILGVDKSKKVIKLSQYIEIDTLMHDVLEKLIQVYIEVNNINHDYALSVIFSHIHMFANRLGIPIGIELDCYKSLLEVINETR